MLKDHKALELDKILLQLANETTCPDAAELAQKIEPDTDIRHVERLLQETDDAFVLMAKYGAPSFYGMTNVTNALRRAEAGGVLNLAELLSVAATLRAIRSVSDWRKKSESVKTALDYRFETLQPNKFIEDRISMTVVSEEEVADTASVALAAIRRKIRAASLRVREQLDKMIRSQTYQKYLQEAIVTQRGGRYVVPVKAEFRNEVKGLIHDSSGSGATVFIEPIGVVEANNEIRVLRSDEKDEIDRILTELSREIGEFADGIIQSYRAAVELNLIFAKGQLAYKMKATVPKLNQEGRIAIKSARHPLIDKNKVVPTDLYLGSDFDALIVTGPNTGGKTVSLKTAGLLTLMTMCGLMIPAADGSEVSIFDHVLADIGDEQSIEQSLSTFSSHMTNIVSFWEQADERSLVLFDELGAGTDPTEGAALAMAILSNLHRRDIRTIATTHYSELKVFALSTPGVENGCCEFSVETLRPTYRLLIGVPGKSNAFAISEKIGLPDYVIEEAKTYLSKEDESFEDVISDLEQSRVLIEREREETNRYREEAEELQKRLSRKEDRLESSRDEILRKAREEAQAILREAKEYADESIRKYNKLGNASGSAKEMEKERTKLREKMTSLQKDNAVKTDKKPKKTLQAKDLRLGDSVKVLSMNLRGTVSTLPDAKGNLFVQMGILRSQVNLRDLEKLDDDLPAYASKKSPATKGTGSGKIKMSKSASISSELNLLGMTTDEAIVELDKYLDDAYLAHLSPVRIVHGKGTGALRKAVHQFLRRQKHVDTYRLGEYGEGDAGVTIVTFK